MSRPLFALLLLLYAGTAFAQPTGGAPHAFSAGTTENMQRPGAAGTCRVAAGPTAQRPVTISDATVTDGSSDGLACWGWGTQLAIYCDEDTKGAFVQSSTVTFGSTGNPYSLSDAEGGAVGTGPASGNADAAFFVPGGTWKVVINSNAHWNGTAAVTSRAKQCNTDNSAVAGYPCDDDDDCGTAGECDVNRKAGCAFLILEAYSSASVCQVCVEH